MPHVPNAHGVYVDCEHVVLARALQTGAAILDLAEADDGTWRLGFTLKTRSPGSSSGARVNGYRYDTREQSLARGVEIARGFCQRVLAGKHLYAQATVHAEAREMLKQIDEAYPPVGTQLTMF